MPNTTIRVVVVDDHQVIRDAFEQFFKRDTVGISVVGVAPTFEDAVALCQLRVPDVVLLDVKIDGGMKAEEAIQQILEVSPDTRILIVSQFTEAYRVRGMIKAGARGYCDKGDALAVVEQGVRAAARGDNLRPWYSPKVERRLLDDTLYRNQPKLTAQQRQIIWLVASGKSYEDIAKAFPFSEQYVREQVSKIYSRLDTDGLTSHSLLALANWARDHGLGPDDPPPPSESDPIG